MYSGFSVTTGNRVTLEHVSTLAKYDLQTLYLGDLFEDELIESPFIQNNNDCLYYQPGEISPLLTDNCELSKFCMNVQGLNAHWDTFHNLVHEMVQVKYFRYH